MKINIIAFFLTLLFPFSIIAQTKIVKGYKIIPRGDTLQTTFKIPCDIFNNLSFSRIQDKIVEINDSTEKKFYPGSIRAFGFEYLSLKYHYVSVSTSTESFFLKKDLGGYLELYSYYYTSQNRNLATGVTVEYRVRKGKFGSIYTVQQISFKKDVLAFVSDYPQLAEKVKNRDYTFSDILKIIKEYNDWKTSNSQ